MEIIPPPVLNAEQPQSALLNRISPTIERVFRFIEMIGVTALLGTVLRSLGLNVVAAVFYVGSAAAIMYLIEPLVDWITLKVMGDKPTNTTVLAGLIVILTSLMLALQLAPIVGFLAFLIGQTISPYS